MNKFNCSPEISALVKGDHKKSATTISFFFAYYRKQGDMEVKWLCDTVVD
jgi:hypothetical protein